MSARQGQHLPGENSRLLIPNVRQEHNLELGILLAVLLQLLVILFKDLSSTLQLKAKTKSTTKAQEVEMAVISPTLYYNSSSYLNAILDWSFNSFNTHRLILSFETKQDLHQMRCNARCQLSEKKTRPLGKDCPNGFDYIESEPLLDLEKILF
jgi:hypothetical protein